ncbi:MAG TPA: glycosyltransferase [Marmoricola sp.]
MTDGTTHDLVTTVMITRDRCERTLRSLAHASGRVVLVDNGSLDGTVEAVRRHFPEVEVVALPENRGAVARNIGVERAGTPYVAFADDDSWWEPGSLALAEQLLSRHPDWAVAVASVLVEPGGRLDPLNEQMLAESPVVEHTLRQELDARLVSGFHACAAVVRADAFLAAGGFDEVVFFGGEEERLVLDLVARGGLVVHLPALVVHHEPGEHARHGRSQQVVRNHLLTAVLRHGWPEVGHRLRQALRRGDLPAVVAAARRLPVALSARDRVPPAVEDYLVRSTGRTFARMKRLPSLAEGTGRRHEDPWSQRPLP